ncbi:MAG: hypothetical protein HQK96_11605 [Nitrospirae bacterium]|nr:hypothetical protein [Nitrospirota bacterium]
MDIREEWEQLKLLVCQRLQPMLSFLLSFQNANFFTLLSGICISLAVNFFTTAFTTYKFTEPMTKSKVYLMAGCFLISAIGAFGLSTFIEDSRLTWQSTGKQSNKAVVNRQRGIPNCGWKILCFLIIMAGVLLYICCITDIWCVKA